MGGRGGAREVHAGEGGRFTLAVRAIFSPLILHQLPPCCTLHRGVGPLPSLAHAPVSPHCLTITAPPYSIPPMLPYHPSGHHTRLATSTSEPFTASAHHTRPLHYYYTILAPSAAITLHARKHSSKASTSLVTLHLLYRHYGAATVSGGRTESVCPAALLFPS